MQKNLLIAVVSVLLFSCGINRNVYKSASFDEKAVDTRTIAVLPFNLTSTGYRPKNVTEKDVQIANERWGYSFQESLHSYLLNRTGRKKKGPVTEFQSLQKTNALLNELKLDITTIYQKQPEELACLLGVDAVIMTSLEQHKNMSDGAAYGILAAKTILTATSSNSPAGLLWINSDNVKMNCYLYTSKNSDLLWKTFRQGGTDLPSNVQGQIEYFCDWIARKFPYKS
jgi:hypothetical protein